MSVTKDLTGMVFGALTVVGKGVNNNDRNIKWCCKCTCGMYTIVYKQSLTEKRATTCGKCGHMKKYPLAFVDTPRDPRGKALENPKVSYTRFYGIWGVTKSKMLNPTHNSYKYYGGLGISISEKWNTFKGFYDDMADSYFKGANLHRKDLKGDFTKDNCYWSLERSPPIDEKGYKSSLGVVGVCIVKTKDGRDISYRAYFKPKGVKPIMEHFSILHYGREEAFRLACEARKRMVEEN